MNQLRSELVKQGQAEPAPMILGLIYVRSLGALCTLGYVEGDFLALFKGSETALFDCAMMNKHLFAIIGSNKTKTLLIIEPFHCSVCHNDTSCSAPDSAKPGAFFCISENRKISTQEY
jgi:hypothetical protein